MLAGFSSTAVVLIAGMLALGEALVASGATQRLARLVERIGGTNDHRLASALMAVAAVPSAFISDVGLVGMFIPVVKDLHHRTRVPVRRLLLPLAIGATLGGLLTMVGSAGNIVGNTALRDAGFPTISLFGITPLSLVILALGILFMILLGRYLLVQKDSAHVPLEDQSDVLREYMTELSVDENSPLIGQTLDATPVFKDNGIAIVRVLRQGLSMMADRNLVFQSGDSLLVLGDAAAITSSNHGQLGLTLVGESQHERRARAQGLVTVSEFLIGHQSPWAGKTILQLNLRRRFGLNVLGLYRDGHLVYQRLASVSLRVGDIILMQGKSDQFSDLHREHGLILLSEPSIRPSRPYGVWMAPLIFMGSLLLAAYFGLTYHANRKVLTT